MQRTFHLLKRAATASPREWRFRAQQMLFATHNWFAAQRGGSAFSPDAFLRALRISRSDLPSWWESRRNRWFLDVEAEKRLVRAAAHAESQLPWVLSQADLVVAGRMPLFAYPPLDFQGEQRWHRDFLADKCAPNQPYCQIPFLDQDVVGDSKHVWEPSRFGWAYWLGIAHRITREDRYADTFARLTRDWFDKNPYPLGIHFTSALEIAIRNYAWVWSLHLFSDYLRRDTELLERMLQGIWTGCRHIERNLSSYFSPNTHLTGEAFALFACGAAIPDFANSASWRYLGQSIMAAEAKRQFHDDGTHRELSSGYHIYSSDFYLQASLIALETGFQVPPEVIDTARHAGLRLKSLAPTDLRLPQMNDCDSGRLTPLVPCPLDAGPSLVATQLLVGDQRVVGDLPARGYPLLMRPRRSAIRPPARSVVEPGIRGHRDVSGILDSGIVTHKNAAGDYLAFRATPFGYGDCPHSHDAPLSVIVHLDGTPIMVDSGTGSYTQSEDLRNQFRSAIGKNTLLVDGTGPSKPDAFFTWSKTTDCELVALHRFQDGVRAVGRHAGFSQSPRFHVFVQREIIALDFGIIAIVDSWDADDKISVRGQFTLDPEIEFDPACKLLHRTDGPSFHVLFANLTLSRTEPLQTSEVPYSASYGLVGTTKSLAYEAVAARNVVATILSRCGAPCFANGHIGFEKRSDIYFEVSQRGLTPRQLVKADAENVPTNSSNP